MHERKLFGERLAAARDNAKMTQTDVAAIFDIKKAAVSAWERGRNMPTVDRIAVLAAEFKVSVDWLVTGNPAAWPLGAEVSPAEIAALPDDLKQQAVGALRVLLLQARSRKALGSVMGHVYSFPAPPQRASTRRMRRHPAGQGAVVVTPGEWGLF